MPENFFSRCWRVIIGPPEGISSTDAETAKSNLNEAVLTIRRVMMMIIAYSLFCLLTLGKPESLKPTFLQEIATPIVDIGVDMVDFLYFGPTILVGLVIYLQIFLGYVVAHEQDRYEVGLPFIFNMRAWIPKQISWIIFYVLPIIVLGVFIRKASPIHNQTPAAHPYLLEFLYGLLILTFISFFILGIRRTPSERRNRFQWKLLWAGLGLSSFYVLILFTGYLIGVSPRGQMP